MPDKINPVPRSVVRRTAFDLLDGEWRFELDVDNSGLRENWFIQHNYTETALFPGSIESHLAENKDIKEPRALFLNNDEVIAWYEREFVVPAEWSREPSTVSI